MKPFAVCLVVVGWQMLLGQAAADTQPAPAWSASNKPGLSIPTAFRDASWSQVLEWLSDETGVPYITSCRPCGRVCLISPQPGQTYTVAENLDIINEELLPQNYLLMRRPACFVLLAFEGKIDPTLLPSPIRLEDLEQHGRTEVVRVMVRLKSVRSEVVASRVEKLLGPCGQVIVLTPGALIVQDMAGNLRPLRDLLTAMDREPNSTK